MGILLTPHKQAKQVMLDFCEALSLVMFKVTELVMLIVPLAICGAVAETIAKNGLQVLVNLGKLIACVYTGLLSFVLLLCLVAILCKIPLKKFVKTIWEPITISFTTASSDAALPLAMEKLVEFGVPKSVVAFTIPVGYTFNLDGTTLYLGAASIFACQAGGIEKTIGEQITMVLLLMLMGKGVAGVPRASLVILASATEQFGLPAAAVPVILTIDNFMDMGRTAVNLSTFTLQPY
jgi:proton glutamate symport protein